MEDNRTGTALAGCATSGIGTVLADHFVRCTYGRWAAYRRWSLGFISAIIGIMSLAAGASAEVVAPLAGLRATLDTVTVIAYYVPCDKGYQVVVTAGTENPDHLLRFVSILAPGQDVVISVPRAVGQPALQLRIQRVGDRVELDRPSS
jgi:hypothetical protein